MALSDLAVFSEYVYMATTEVITQQTALFNENSNGTMLLRVAENAGDYSDRTFWGSTAGLVRRRNAYGTGSVAEKSLGMLVDTMVKIAAGTPPIRLDPSEMKWIQQDPATRGAALGQQLAKQTMADMVNTAVMIVTAALLGQSGTSVYDGSAVGDGKFTLAMYNEGQRLLGDTSDNVVAWLQHSHTIFDVYAANLTNAAHLFTFGNVAIRQDPFGRTIIMADLPALVNLTPTPDVYYTLGLVPGAVEIERNNDYVENTSTVNGTENITSTYQAEWSYNAGVKGFTWDKTNGGKSPTDSALGTSTNWDKIATSYKDLAGILIKSL
jgi:hypothetical protein